MLARRALWPRHHHRRRAVEGCRLGNFPQAFSHIGLINAARSLMEQPDRES